MGTYGTDETLCPVCGQEHAAADVSCPAPRGAWETSDLSTGASGGDASDHTRRFSKSLVAPATLEPGAQVGEFIVEKQIGSGGMGVIYRATHPIIGKRAVIKIIKASLGGDTEHVQRFIREARAVNQIGHPNIVDVFSFGTLPDKRPYLVMEWLQGETLGARLERGRIPLREAVEILMQMLSALDAAHTHGVVHRDLKPDNIYLVALPNDERPLVKLLDFGLALITEAEKDMFLRDREEGVILGTPSYLSPEVARGTEVDHRADIYALAVLAFEMLTGRRPFVGKTLRDTVFMHMTATPPSVRALDPSLPEAIEELLLQMMAKNPAQRPTLSRVRAVLGALFDQMTAVGDTNEAHDEETTGARTSDFALGKPARAEAASTGWTGEVERFGLEELQGTATPAPEAATRVDDAPLRVRGATREPSITEPTPLTPGREPSDERISGVGTRLPGAPMGSDTARMARDLPLVADLTRVDSPLGGEAAPRRPLERRMDSLPSIRDEELLRPSTPPPQPAPRVVAFSLPAEPAAQRKDPTPSLHAIASASGLYDSAARREEPAVGLLARLRADPRRLGLMVACVGIFVAVVLFLTVTWGALFHDEVRLTVRGLPANATLTWGGVPLKENPTNVRRGSRPVELTISSPGYETSRFALVPDSDLEFSVGLVEQRGAPAR